jgi:4-hydroxy-tetrahydrodipicolinate synthase
VLGTIITAMATPFDADLRVDEAAAARLVEHLLANGSDGLVMAGTTGESATLTDEEKIGLVRLAVREAAGGARVIAGSGSNDTAHSVHLTHAAAEAGADAALVVTPYYNRPPRAGIVGHVEAIASVGLPIVLYNIPSRTTLNMDPSLLAELAQIPGVVAVKQANPDLAECRTVVEDGALTVYAGNDDMLLPVLEMGGAGVIAVASHLVGPEMRRIADAVARGELEEARAQDAALADLYAGLFATTNPILVKAGLELAGVIPSGRLRLPLVEATAEERERLRAVLEHHGVLTRA